MISVGRQSVSGGSEDAIYADGYTWESVYPEWASGYGWTHGGELRKLRDDEYIYGAKSKLNISHTPLNKPITVHSGEVWHLVTNVGMGFSDLSCVVILNSAGKLLWSQKCMSTPVDGIYFTVPEGGSKMYLTYLNSQKFVLEKKIRGKDAVYDIKNDTALMAFCSGKAHPKENDKAYLIFCADDLRKDIDVYEKIFEEAGLPLCIAAIADSLSNVTSGGRETNLELCRRVEQRGGEILCHSDVVITRNNQYDSELIYKQFVGNKSVLTSYGFDVDGIIEAGGAGTNTADRERLYRWTEAFYSYSDLYGKKDPYYHPRYGMAGKSVNSIKQQIDIAINKKEMMVLFWHDQSEISAGAMREILSYVKSLPSSKVEVTTYRKYYA
ncbi:MAG: hypothetical protein K6E30_01100 [Lachnospiraceae bacterium]|nr:hypothetical protein [Lachnospiraceae bacterium]